MKENRDKIIELVFGSEAGYVNRKTDAGGPTNMGITQRTLAAWRGHDVTIDDVKQLTRAEAWDIYASEYWRPIKGDELPSGLDYCIFDSCVTSGPSRAVKLLQEVLVLGGASLLVDGIIGKETITACEQYRDGILALIKNYCKARIDWMRTLKGSKGFSANGRGWTIRVTGIDPKGEWAPQPGVVGTALKLAVSQRQPAAAPPVTPANLPVEATAKARDSSTGLGTIIAKPEAAAGILAAAAALLTAASANSILSYALAFLVVVATTIGGYYFVNRIRRGGSDV